MKKKIMEEVSQIKKMMGLNEEVNLPDSKMNKIDWQETDEIYVKVRGVLMDSSRMEQQEYSGYILQSDLEQHGIDPSFIVDIKEDYREPGDDYFANRGNSEGGIGYGSKNDYRDLKR